MVSRAYEEGDHNLFSPPSIHYFKFLHPQLHQKPPYPVLHQILDLDGFSQVFLHPHHHPFFLDVETKWRDEPVVLGRRSKKKGKEKTFNFSPTTLLIFKHIQCLMKIHNHHKPATYLHLHQVYPFHPHITTNDRICLLLTQQNSKVK